LRLAEALWRDFDRRRAYQWKVNFALWSALGSFAGLSLKINQPLGIYWTFFVMVVLIFIGYFYWFRWSVGIMRRNVHDQQGAHYYWGRVDGDPNKTDPWPGRDKAPKAFQWKGSTKFGLKKVIRHWSHGSEVYFYSAIGVPRDRSRDTILFSVMSGGWAPSFDGLILDSDQVAIVEIKVAVRR
jgi:hypothetical protein